MSVEVLNEMDEMNSLIDKYLTEDDKALIHGKVRGAKVKSISQNNQFLLHSVATKVKSFVQDGHFTAFMAYGLDYMVLGESSTFTLSGFTDIEELSEFTYSYCFEWNESQTGGIDEHMLDLIYVWLLTSPYVAMSMTERFCMMPWSFSGSIRQLTTTPCTASATKMESASQTKPFSTGLTMRPSCTKVVDMKTSSSLRNADEGHRANQENLDRSRWMVNNHGRWIRSGA